MSGERLQRIVEEVVSRLQRRAQSAVTLSVAQLRDADPRSLCCRNSSLRILQVDVPLLEQIAEGDSSNNAAVMVHEALAFGLRVQLSVQRHLLPALPVRKLARLPLTFSDEQGQTVILHPVNLFSYADIARLSQGVVVLRRRCIVTALAREAAVTRHIQLIKQE